ncbi:MAG: MBOAT family O-acyltransferase [Vicingaceae bacterium]
MVFSSVLFLFIFLPVFLLIYHLLDKRFKNSFALAASLSFYAWGAPDFITLALISIFIDFLIVRGMNMSQGRLRFFLLWLSILLNVGFLAYFKYANFFIENVNQLLSSFSKSPIEWTSIVLPIGISFYTFQKISYSIDIYRKVKPPLNNLFDYALYIMLFPQLIAGPIVRYNEIADQLISRDHYNWDDKILGLFRFSIGLAKKVLIANVVGAKADLIFSLNPAEISTSEAWLGILCYTFQIYFDFSGYSDMAIGLGRMMGFTFPENFNSPYISKSITEFWRRWHITLSSWMRDYLYIPLGGNKVATQSRLYFNLWLVFIISGLWHGAAWTFVIWGVYHGFFLIIERLFFNKLSQNWPSALKVLLTFFIAVNSWVLFRADYFSFALDYYKALYSFNFSDLSNYLDAHLLTILVFAIFMSFGAIWKKLYHSYNGLLQHHGISSSFIKVGASLLFIFLSASEIISSSFNPFIYFRF